MLKLFTIRLLKNNELIKSCSAQEFSLFETRSIKKRDKIVLNIFCSLEILWIGFKVCLENELFLTKHSAVKKTLVLKGFLTGFKVLRDVRVFI